MFAVEYALARLWQSWGIEPTAVMGHSLGEFVAACVAGVLTLEDGLRLIAQRARLMQSLPSGGLMAAVFTTEAEVRSAIETDRVSIAALNGPRSIVVSGDEPAVRELLRRFEEKGISSKTLVTSHAFHSYRMDPILGTLEEAAALATPAPPKIDLVSNLTGRLADPGTYAQPGYWSRHARSPVRFAEGIEAMVAAGCDIFLEIGPSPTLIGMGRQCLPENGRQWLPSLRPGRDDWQTILEALARLYVRGVKVDWSGFDRGYTRRKVELPNYPFQRRRYWTGLRPDASDSSRAAPRSGDSATHPLLGRRLVAAVNERVFESQIAAERPATLADHKVQGTVVMPGAAYLEMALAASAALHDKPWSVVHVRFHEPLVLDKKLRTVQTVVTPDGPAAASFRIASLVPTDSGEPSFTVHASGRLEATAAPAENTVDLNAEQARFTGEPRDEAWQAEALRKSGLEPGPTFTWNPLHWVQEGEVLAEVRAPRDGDRVEQYQVHPGLLDCGFQSLGAALPGAGSGIDAYVPFSVERLEWHGGHQGAKLVSRINHQPWRKRRSRQRPARGRRGTPVDEDGGRPTSSSPP